MTDGYLNFDEYIRQGEPEKRLKADAWRVAIGLQAVDGLSTSEYLRETARKNIEGEITIDEARELVKQYYITKTSHDEDDANKEEADKVSSNISKLLQTDAFTYSVAGMAAIHRSLFEGIFKHAGSFRNYDISKKEWVLEGDSVIYARWQELQMTLEYDLKQEKQFVYSDLEKGQMAEHVARFVSGLWQIHPFREGNTRTIAIFVVKYLRSLGFNVDNDQFAKHSWYFRNALVRANYRNVAKGIEYTPVYLERFFRNLLLGEQWDLRNRYLHIHPTAEWKTQPNLAAPISTPTSSGQAPEQAPNNYRISSSVINLNTDSKFYTNNEDIIELVRIIGNDELSISQMMDIKKLKHRQNFMDTHLAPALQEKFVRRKYPDRPNHPRQKYLLTVKGLALYNELMKTQ